MPATFTDAVDTRADVHALARYVIARVNAFADGEDVVLDFLTRDAVGAFCSALGIDRNWAMLSIDEIAPTDPPTGSTPFPRLRG